jgi:hypothetical protein
MRQAAQAKAASVRGYFGANGSRVARSDGPAKSPREREVEPHFHPIGPTLDDSVPEHLSQA